MNALISQDDAVETINRIVRTKGLEAMDDLGRFVLDTFFAGDVEAFQTHGPKDFALQQVADRDDCEVGRITLLRAVRIMLLLAAQPKLREYGLSPTHLRALLTVASPERRLELAQQAAAEKLDGTTFEAMVNPPKRISRRRTPRWTRVRTKVSRSLRTLTREAPTRALFEGVTRAEAKRSLEALEQDQAAYNAWLAEMRTMFAAVHGSDEDEE